MKQKYSGLLALGSLQGKTIAGVTINSGGIGLRLEFEGSDYVEINGYYEPLEVDYYEQDFNRPLPKLEIRPRRGVHLSENRIPPRCIHPPIVSYEDKIFYALASNGSLWTWEIANFLAKQPRISSPVPAQLEQILAGMEDKKLIYQEATSHRWRINK